MQRLDDKKRRDILKVAEEMFAKRPFHEVKLDHVAARAKIGKGTIYIYFRSKEDLFVGLVREGLADVVQRMREQAAKPDTTGMQQLEGLVQELALFATTRPHMYHLLRTVLPKQCESELRPLRSEIVSMLREAIDRGVARGEMRDSHPDLTAQYIMGAVRGVALFVPHCSDTREVTSHIMQVFGSGLSCRKVSRS